VLASTFCNKLLVLDISLFDKELDYSIGDGRQIERGANIVGHEPGLTGTKCLLQMPRGNLEQIHPRDLLVERTKTLINRREYQNALKEMRRHRLNMNLIFDHDPNAFLSHIPEFVSQFDASKQLDLDLLQLFIAALEDEDCTKTLFVKSYKNSPLASKKECAVTVVDKVEKICKLILDEIKGRETSMELTTFQRFYLVILSCYVKPKSSNVVEALLDLKKRADQCK
jgi:elongator complex protein 1